MTETKKDIKSLTLEELTEEIKTLGEKPFRAGQLFSWMHEKYHVSSSFFFEKSKLIQSESEMTSFLKKQDFTLMTGKIQCGWTFENGVFFLKEKKNHSNPCNRKEE